MIFFPQYLFDNPCLYMYCRVCEYVLVSVKLLLFHRNLVLKFKFQLSCLSKSHSMHNSNLIIANANQSIEMLLSQRVSLQIQNNIHKLKSILNQQHSNTLSSPLQRNQKGILPFGERLSNNSTANYLRNHNSILHEQTSKTAQIKQVNNGQEQINLNVVQQAINNLSLLHLTAQQYLFPNKENSQPSAKQYNQSLSNFSLREIVECLQKLIYELKLVIQIQNKSSQQIQDNSNSQCKSQTNCAENSSSVRSLLTQKLRQFASQDFEDPQYKNHQIVHQGNLMKQLNSLNKPIIVSRRFQDLSQPFSMQNKHYNQKTNGAKIMNKLERGRVQSQRTILGEINLSSSHGYQKKSKKTEGGCSRCQIF